MDSRDFSNIGDKIRNTVEDAMNSANYQQLNQKINQTVDMAMNEARRQFGNYQRANKTPYVNVPNQQPGQMNRQPVIRRRRFES